MTAKFEIIEQIATVGKRRNGETLELRKMRWNDGAELYDLRWWLNEEPHKGVTMNANSLLKVSTAIDTMDWNRSNWGV